MRIQSDPIRNRLLEWRRAGLIDFDSSWLEIERLIGADNLSAGQYTWEVTAEQKHIIDLLLSEHGLTIYKMMVLQREGASDGPT